MMQILLPLFQQLPVKTREVSAEKMRRTAVLLKVQFAAWLGTELGAPRETNL